MKRIKANKFLYIFITETIFALVFFPLFDMFFRVVVDKKEFIYSVNEHIIGPITFGLFYTLFTIVFNKNDEQKWMLTLYLRAYK